MNLYVIGIQVMTESVISNDLVERKGPRTDPCGTPNGRCCGPDSNYDVYIGKVPVSMFY